MNPSLVMEYLTRQNWCLHEPILRQMVAIAERHCRGDRLSAEEIAAATGRKNAPPPQAEPEMQLVGDTAIIHVDGVIAKYSRLVNGVSQPRGTSIEQLRKNLQTALRDPECKAILLRIESPGGSADGLPDFADELYAASQQKCVVGICDDLAASAAYWMGSQCIRLYANQSALVGSIGCYTAIADISRMAEDAGIHVHLVSSGPHKATGLPGVPISAEQLKPFQAIIDSLYRDFLAAICRGRAEMGLTAERLAPQADGRCFMAREALAGGLIDGICTLEAALAARRPGLRSRTTQVAGITMSAVAAESQTDKETLMTKTNETTGTPAPAAPTTGANPPAPAAPPKAETPAPQPDAVSVERARIAAIDAALDGEDLKALRTKAIAEGMTPEAAKAAAFEVLKTALATTRQNAAQLQTRLDAIAKGGTKLAAPPEAPRSAESSADGGDPQAFLASVQEFMKAGKSKAEAIREAAVANPAAHAAWIESTQP